MTTQAVPQSLVDGLAARLTREDDVLAAYVFGSRARGTAGPRSDVDVAVLLDGEADPADRDLALRAVLGDEVDLVILNKAPVALAYRVVSEGVLVLSRDERVRQAHWARTIDQYLDTAPMRRTLERGLHRRLREGRFGRP